MRTIAITLTAALLALAAPVTAEDVDADTAIECGWCCFLGPIDYAQCMGTMVYESNAPGGAAGQVTDAYWGATMHTVDVVQGAVENVAVDLPAGSSVAACGWCCGLGTIDYLQCMGEEAYPETGGPAGQVVRVYWDATMEAVDVVQDNLPAANAAAVKFGCGGTTVPDDVVCFAEGVPAPLLYCYGTVEGVVTCIAYGELENWRQFNRNVCDHHFCIMP